MGSLLPCLAICSTSESNSWEYHWQAVSRCLTHLTLCNFCSLRLASSYYQLREDAKILSINFFLFKHQEWHSEWVTCWKLRSTCLFFISVCGCLCTAERGGRGGSGGGKREAEWVEDWNERRIEAVRGGGSKRVNPEQVNTAVDSHGLSGCLPPVVPMLCRGPEEPAGASQSCSRVGRVGQPSQERGRWGGWAVLSFPPARSLLGRVEQRGAAEINTEERG